MHYAVGILSSINISTSNSWAIPYTLSHKYFERLAGILPLIPAFSIILLLSSSAYRPLTPLLLLKCFFLFL